MIMLQKILLGLIFTLLTGCSEEPANSNPSANNAKVFKNIEYKYEVIIPTKLSRWTKWSEGFDQPSYPTFTTPRGAEDEIRATILHSSSSCSTDLTGVTNLHTLSEMDQKSLWGEVDYFKRFYIGDSPEDFADLCRPPVNGSAYVLCSEKDNKTVVICISQHTDNPDLAKQIFETFRWTE